MALHRSDQVLLESSAVLLQMCNAQELKKAEDKLVRPRLISNSAGAVDCSAGFVRISGAGHAARVAHRLATTKRMPEADKAHEGVNQHRDSLGITSDICRKCKKIPSSIGQ